MKKLPVVWWIPLAACAVVVSMSFYSGTSFSAYLALAQSTGSSSECHYPESKEGVDFVEGSIDGANSALMTPAEAKSILTTAKQIGSFRATDKSGGVVSFAFARTTAGPTPPHFNFSTPGTRSNDSRVSVLFQGDEDCCHSGTLTGEAPLFASVSVPRPLLVNSAGWGAARARGRLRGIWATCSNEAESLVVDNENQTITLDYSKVLRRGGLDVTSLEVRTKNGETTVIPHDPNWDPNTLTRKSQVTVAYNKTRPMKANRLVFRSSANTWAAASTTIRRGGGRAWAIASSVINGPSDFGARFVPATGKLLARCIEDDITVTLEE